MKKLGIIVLICFCVAVAYVVILAGMPAIREIAQIANSTVTVGNYTEAMGFVSSMPYWILFLPAGIGFAAVVITLKA